jgi:hypothetical protein
MKLTVDSILALNPCDDWPRERIEEVFGKRYDATFADLLADNRVPFADALWLFCAVLSRDGNNRLLRWFACWCAWQVSHLMKDDRSVNAVRVAQRFARGQATHEERAAAGAAAGDNQRRMMVRIAARLERMTR